MENWTHRHNVFCGLIVNHFDCAMASRQKGKEADRRYKLYRFYTSSYWDRTVLRNWSFVLFQLCHWSDLCRESCGGSELSTGVLKEKCQNHIIDD